MPPTVRPRRLRPPERARLVSFENGTSSITITSGHSAAGDVRPIGRGLSELRLDVGPGYRVYYLQEGDSLILLLCGGDKSTQQKDIDRAYELADRWHEDKKEGKG